MTTTPTLAAPQRSRTSTIVLKILMAVTGLVFIAYVLLHMYGNLKIFAGQDAFDTYAHHLRTIGEPFLPFAGLIWILRVVLLVSVAVHAFCAVVLWRRAHGARTQRYAVRRTLQASWSSRTMRYGGIALLLFVVFHLLHLTTHTINPGGPQDTPYDRVVTSFSPDNWWVAVIYLLAMVFLAMHLRHGTFSAAQTLGLTSSPAAARAANFAGYTLAILIAGGFSLVPLACLVGIVD